MKQQNIHGVLFLFLVLDPEICFSPDDPMPGRKGLSIQVLLHSLVRDNGACVLRFLPLIQRNEKGNI